MTNTQQPKLSDRIADADRLMRAAAQRLDMPVARKYAIEKNRLRELLADQRKGQA